MGKRVVIYCRSARDDDYGAAMQKQSALLCEQARRENMEITAEVHGYESGSTLDRPGWNKAVQLAVENGEDAILVEDSARVLRNPIGVVREMEKLQTQGIEVINADGKLLTFTYEQMMEDLRERAAI